MSISKRCFYFCQLSMFSIHPTDLLEAFTFQEQANILSTAFGAYSLLVCGLPLMFLGR